MKRRTSGALARRADVEDTRAQLIPCSVRLQPDLHELRHARAGGTGLLERGDSALVVGENVLDRCGQHRQRLEGLFDPLQCGAMNLSVMRLHLGDSLDISRVLFPKYPQGPAFRL
jgi:hypothetical protein